MSKVSTRHMHFELLYALSGRLLLYSVLLVTNEHV